MLRQIHNQPLPFSGHGAHNEIAQMVQKAESFNKMMSFYDSTVEKYASQPMEVLSLQQMLQFGTRSTDTDRVLKSARYAQREIPKRLARRLLDLQLLPFIVVTNPHIKKVYNSYITSFETIRSFPLVTTLEENNAFCAVLRQQLDLLAPMLDSLSAGLRECMRKELVGEYLRLDSFFDNMLRSRISRRVIAEQHLQMNNPRPGFVGTISTHLDVADAIEFAAQKTQQVCIETFGYCPDVVVTGDKTATLSYVPAHLDYMLYELLKNAMRWAAVVVGSLATLSEPALPQSIIRTSECTAIRATVESREGSRGGVPLGPYTGPLQHKLPPVVVRICAGPTELTIKVCDQGGGIPDAIIDKVWSYGFTTVTDQSPLVTGTANGNPAHKAATAVAGAAANGASSDGAAIQTPFIAPVLPTAPTFGVMQAGGDTNGSRFRLAGLGFGLPLSRLYARYFKGDLSLHSIPGCGTDAYLTLQKLDAQEWQERVDEPTPSPCPTQRVIV
ncbi:MAG: hypothetical protein WDW38_007176 [Sanguina aurantia]